MSVLIKHHLFALLSPLPSSSLSFTPPRLPPCHLSPQLVATAALFLAAKSEEQPRKLQYVVQASHACVYKDEPMLDIQSQVHVGTAEGGLAS